MSQNGHNIKQQVEAQQTQQEQSAGLGIAQEEAAQGSFNPRELLSSEFLTEATEIDIDRSYPDEDQQQHNLGEKLAAETSSQIQTGNITREDWKYYRHMDRARASATKCQYAAAGGVGAKCTGSTRSRMTGDRGAEHMELTPDFNQQLQSGYRTISMARSKSIGAAFMRRLLETIAVTKSEGYDAPEQDPGLLSRLTGGLL